MPLQPQQAGSPAPSFHAALLHYCGARDALALMCGVKPAAAPRMHRHTFHVFSLYDSCLMHDERLDAVCCGGAASVALQLVQGGGHHAAFASQRAHKFGTCVIKRVAAGRAAVMRDKLFEQGLGLQRACNFSAAATCFAHACALGHSRAHACLSWMLLHGRQRVPKDKQRSFQLADTGVRLGCDDSKGALACCLLHAQAPENGALALQLARESAAAGCSYGQFALGKLHRNGVGGVALDLAVAVELYRAAAAQGLAEAQYSLGLMHQQGCGVAQSYDDALRWYSCAAAQGQPTALLAVGELYERGVGVAQSTAEAVAWFTRAADAGEGTAREALQRYRVLCCGGGSV